MGSRVPDLRRQLELLSKTPVALQVPLRLAYFAARELDFVAKCQPVGQILPRSSLFGDRDDLIGERDHFVQTIGSPHDKEPGGE